MQSHGKNYFFGVFKWVQAKKEKGAWFEISEESEPEFSHYFLFLLVK